MKKILFTTLAVCAGFIAANAQTTSSYSTGTNHIGGVWVTSQTAVTLNLNDIITITPASDAVSANFTAPSDLTNGLVLGGGNPQTYTVQSNRVFDVTVGTDVANFTASNTDNNPVPGDNTTMPASVLKLKIPAGGNNTGGSVAAPFDNTYAALAPVSAGTYSLGNGNGPGAGHGALLILDGMPGGSQTFTTSLMANPGWAYAGGTYKINVIYTAAQE